jgi:hypothetical protein
MKDLPELMFLKKIKSDFGFSFFKEIVKYYWDGYFVWNLLVLEL